MLNDEIAPNLFSLTLKKLSGLKSGGICHQSLYPHSRINEIRVADSSTLSFSKYRNGLLRSISALAPSSSAAKQMLVGNMTTEWTKNIATSNRAAQGCYTAPVVIAIDADFEDPCSMAVQLVWVAFGEPRRSARRRHDVGHGNRLRRHLATNPTSSG